MSPITDSDCICVCRPTYRTLAGSPGISGVPISTAKVGDKGVITRISGKPDTKKFLANLGFLVGAPISAVCCANGSMVVDVHGSRVAVDRDMANKIIFDPEN